MSTADAFPLAKTTLALTEAEDLLINFLLQAIAYSKRSTVVRIAGGWVRDKILSLANDDIDLATDDMVGEDFAALLNNYLAHLGLETKTVAIIQANPGQSKHLVTANIHIDLAGFRHLQYPNATPCPPGTFKYDLDCVNLRAETYADDSRIPTMRFGTALEDALRRDFTINSLFYNCATRSIEDLTGHGQEDLISGLVRTPLPPSVTFLDDPLRILRAVRFAARFDYRLHADICRTVCTQPTIAAAFACKISKERVCKEMDGALGGKLNRPPLALWLVYRLGLLDKIFSVPSPEVLAAENKTIVMRGAGLIATESESASSSALAASDATATATTATTAVAVASLGNWTLASWRTVYWTSVLLAVHATAAAMPSCTVPLPSRQEQLHSFRQLLEMTEPPNAAVTRLPMQVALTTVLENLGAHLLRPSIYGGGAHRALFWASACSGLRSFDMREQHPPTTGKKGKVVPSKVVTYPLVQAILRDSLRMDAATQRVVLTAHECAPLFREFAKEVQELLLLLPTTDWHHQVAGSVSNTVETASATDCSLMTALASLRVRIGTVLKHRTRELWRICLLFACATEMTEGEESLTVQQSQGNDSSNNSSSSSGGDDGVDSALEFGSAQFLAWSERAVPAGILPSPLRAIVFKYAVLQYMISDCLYLDEIWKMPFIYDVSLLVYVCICMCICM